MAKKVIRLNEADFGKIVKGAVENILKEGKKSADPMIQWYKDMEDAQDFRDTMDYVTKGGRRPKGWKRGLEEKAMPGGNDVNAVHKWVYWCFNWQPIEEYADIFKGAPKEHFIDKFYNGCHGDMNRFYVELNKTNQAILTDYVMNNFKG